MLVKHVQPLVACSAIRFLRRVVALNDPVFIQEVVKHKILDPILEVFIANGARYNMLNSVVLELICFIRTNNLRSLVAYIVTEHEHKFENVRYVQTFRQLRRSYDENMASVNTSLMDESEDVAASASEYRYFEGASDSDSDTAAVQATAGAIEGEVLLEQEVELDEKFLEMASARKRKIDEEEGDVMRFLGKKGGPLKKQKNGPTGVSNGFLQFAKQQESEQ